MKTKIILIVMICGFMLPVVSYGQAVDSYFASSSGNGNSGSYCTGVGVYSINDGNGGDYNSAYGAGALQKNSSGVGNTGVGYNALYVNQYGSYNSAFGSNALKSATASENSAFGYESLESTTTSEGNCAFGFLSIYQNTTGANNTGIGYEVLNTNVTGNSNCALGFGALYTNSAGNSNVAIGLQALNNNTVSWNVAVGDSALASNTIGTGNTALGYQSLGLNTTAINNTAIGYNSLYNNQTGIDNVAMGYQALYNNTYRWNTAIGVYALLSNTSAESNTAVGYQALEDATTNGDNTALGAVALQNNTAGGNTAVGYAAMLDNTYGADNTALGLEAVESNTTGNYNTFLGYETGGSSQTTYSNCSFIGYNAVQPSPTVGGPLSNIVVLGNTTIGAIYAEVTTITSLSDGRYKKNIKQDIPGLVFINKLTPISYNYDIQGLNSKIEPDYKPTDIDEQAIKAKEQTRQNGFIAQDVEKAAQAVGYNFSGVDVPADPSTGIYGLRYSDFVIPLVKAVQELSAKSDSKDSAIANQQQNIDSLIKQNSNLQASKVVDEAQLATQQSEIDQLNTMVSKLDAALSQCCTSYQSTTGSAAQPGSGGTPANATPYLNQNFPNPFSQNTTISCYVPTIAQNASVIVYNLNGQMLKSFTVPATGFNQVVIGAGTLAAGDYLYTLYVNGQKVDTKTMTLTH